MTEERRLYRRVVGGVAIAVGATGGLGAGVAWAIDGGRSAAAAAVGGLTALAVSLAGPAAMFLALRRTSGQLAFTIASAWLAAILTAGVVLTWASRFDAPARASLAATFGGGVLAGLVVKVVLTVRARVPYVDPGSS